MAGCYVVIIITYLIAVMQLATQVEIDNRAKGQPKVAIRSKLLAEKERNGKA